MDFPELQPGDIAACYGSDFASRAIQLGTASLCPPRKLWLPPSHVAVVCRYGDEPVWVESTSLCSRACRVAGEVVQGVQAHHPRDRIEDYVAWGGRVDWYRLVEVDALSTAESRLLSRILIDRFLRSRASYDYIGALLSGTRAFQLTRLFPGADLAQLFCSELIAAVLMRLGRMNRANPTRFNPGRLMRTLTRTGVYRFHHACEARS